MCDQTWKESERWCYITAFCREGSEAQVASVQHKELKLHTRESQQSAESAFCFPLRGTAGRFDMSSFSDLSLSV